MKQFLISLTLVFLTNLASAQASPGSLSQSYCYTESQGHYFSNARAGETVARCANDYRAKEADCFSHLKCIPSVKLDLYCYTFSNDQYFSHYNPTGATASCSNSFTTSESDCNQNLKCFGGRDLSQPLPIPQLPAPGEDQYCFTHSNGRNFSDSRAGEAVARCSNDYNSTEAECFANLKCYGDTAPPSMHLPTAPNASACNQSQLARCLKFSGGLACYSKWQCPKP